MNDCIFCKIARGEIKASVVYKNDRVLAFEDLDPKAPVHVLIVPRKHVERISDVREGDPALASDLFVAATEIARQKGVETSGYRLVINCNKDAGQEVPHLHLHLLGGRKFTWPPG